MHPAQQIEASFLRHKEPIPLEGVPPLPPQDQAVAVHHDVEDKPPSRLEHTRHLVEHPLVVGLVVKAPELAERQGYMVETTGPLYVARSVNPHLSCSLSIR